jgi:hypothetical protein
VLNGKATVLDFDDLCDTNDPWDDLLRLRERVPDLRLTLFCIPARTSPETFAKYDAARDWCRLGVHGWRHSRHECLGWTSEETEAKIDMAMAVYPGFDRVFKAPNWEIDSEVYAGCKAKGFAVADHVRNTPIMPKDMPHYTYNLRLRSDHYDRHHGHIQNWGGTGLREAFETYAALKGPFLFVSEALQDHKELAI